MRCLVAPQDALGEAPFTVEQAAAVGLTPKMLRGRRFRRLAPQVYAAADLEITPQVRAQVARLAVPDAVLSHASAAMAYGLPLGISERTLTRVHLTVPVTSGPVRLPLVVAHRMELTESDLRLTALGQATAPARTWLDRCAELDAYDAAALGDAILRRGLATREELALRVEAAVGRRGVRTARLVLPLLDPRSASPMESRTRVVLVLGGCARPEVNADIFDDAGGWLARGDLVWRWARLIIEYDGVVHLDERQRRADQARRNLLIDAGWTVLTFTAQDVLRRPYEMIALVKRQLALAGS